MFDQDGTIERPFFVWVRGLSGLRPQKWSELNPGLRIRRNMNLVVAWQPITTEEFHWPLEQLAQL
jgi:hypothetical protein